MFAYLIMSIPVALMAMTTPMRTLRWPAWVAAFAVLVFVVGLRHNVGMDWNNYQLMIQNVTLVSSLSDAMLLSEPGYALILRASGQLGLGVYGANVVVAIILMLGLFRYARTTPSPWLALISAIPFLVVVTGMSANRQAAAIGVLLWAVAGWSRYSLLQRIALVGLAASFHASAILFLILVLADVQMPRVSKIAALVVMAAAALYFLVLTDRFDYYDQAYGTGQGEITQSSGAVFHVLINGGPALVYFLWRRHRQVLLPDNMHRYMAVCALALIPLAFFASAASGRMALYLFPVSMYFTAAIPLVLHGRETKFLYKVGAAVFFVALLVFWLLASNTGVAYVPYRNLLNIDHSERQLCC